MVLKQSAYTLDYSYQAKFLYLQKFTSVFKQSAGHRTVRQYLKPFVIFTNLKNIYQYIILEVDSTFLS